MKTLFAEEQLRQGIRRMADEIRARYGGRPLTIVGVMIGSIVLLADLYRNLPYVAMLEPHELGEEPHA